jgi:glyoxylase-like metal-dependent hydrolase (beta-lactamase superfamily II)
MSHPASGIRITPIPGRSLFDSNAYLLAGADGFVLIDSSVPKRRPELVEAIERAGCGPCDLRLIVITHVHSDHTGNAAYLSQRFGAPIALHAGDAGKAERADMFWRPEGLTASMRVARALTRVTGIARFEPFTPDVLLEDGQRLDDFGLAATAYHFPGHSPGSLGIVTDAGDFFCGDLLVGGKQPERNTIIDTRADYDASVERLRTLPVATVYPGHGAPFPLMSFRG